MMCCITVFKQFIVMCFMLHNDVLHATCQLLSHLYHHCLSTYYGTNVQLIHSSWKKRRTKKPVIFKITRNIRNILEISKMTHRNFQTSQNDSWWNFRIYCHTSKGLIIFQGQLIILLEWGNARYPFIDVKHHLVTS